MNRGEKISGDSFFVIGLLMALIEVVIGIVSISLLSKYPEAALDLQGVFLWGFALCLVYLTAFAVIFIIRNK